MLAKETQNQGDKLMKGKTGSMLPETRRTLSEFYKPYNKQLAQLLGDDGYLWKTRQLKT